MKKFTSILLLLAIITGGILTGNNITFANPSENLLINGGFEDGITADWKSYTLDEVLEENDEEVCEGEMSCLVTGRTAPWSSLYQDITEIVKEWGKGEYIISAYVKLVSPNEKTVKSSMTVVTHHQKDGIPGGKWLSTGTKIVNSESFTKIEGTINIDWEESYASGIIYLQNASGGNNYDYYVDDFSMVKKDGVKNPHVEPTPMPIEKVDNRAEKTLVGAIRWDAWVNPSEKWGGANIRPDNYIGAQMARSLGPAQYHYRAPYFTIVKSANEITFPDYTQEIFDEEMRYAMEAGIDYFMYCWYGEDDIMSSARKYHVNSQYRNNVKMCAMLNIATVTNDDYDYWINNFKLDCWQKVDGNRPLIYADNVADQRYTAHIVNKFRNKCMEAGLGNPYIIGLEQFGATPENVKELGFDAIGDYAAGGGVDAGEFKDLAHDIWIQWYEWKAKGIQIVPLVSTGWDRRPRIDHPVTWEGPTKNKLDFTNTATPQEIADHLKQALDFNKNNPDLTTANTVLIYAWNEHDEGGWLCPTLVDDDGDGIPLKRSDGTNARDTRRLQAIQKVLRPDAVWSLDNDVALEGDYVVPNYQTVPPTSEATQKPTSTEAPANNNDNGNNYLFIIIGACTGVVVLSGLTATIVILNKKKKTKEFDEE